MDKHSVGILEHWSTNNYIIHMSPVPSQFLVKWTFEIINYVTDGIPVELFQILKDNAVKVLHSICQQVCKTQ